MHDGLVLRETSRALALVENCPAEAELADFVEARLAESRVAEVAGHLDVCPECEGVVVRLEREQCGRFKRRDDASTLPELLALKPGQIAGLPAHAPDRGHDGAYALDCVQVGDEIGDCRLLRELGRGSFARVFLAEQTSLRRLVALKVSTRRSMEPELLSTLDHPHIVRVHHYDERTAAADGLHLLYMQHISGCTLQQVIEHVQSLPALERSGQAILTFVEGELRRRGELGPSETASRSPLAQLDWPATVCWIGARLAHALHYAHELGVHHRDVKPANILLTRDGVPMLVDFNVSFAAGRDGACPEDYFGGSLPYMSPEQLETFAAKAGAEQVQGASDVYSLTVVLWELLTGERPFRAETVHAATTVEIAARIRSAHGEPFAGAAPAHLPRDFDLLLRRGLAPDPAQRPAAKALGRQLYLHSLPQSPNILFPPIPPRWLRCLATFLYFTVFLLPNAHLTLLSILHQIQFTLRKPGWDSDYLLRVETPAVILACNALGVIANFCFAWPALKVILRRTPREEVDDVETYAWVGSRILYCGAFSGAVMLALWMAGAVVLPGWNWLAGPQSSLEWRNFWDFVVPHVLFGMMAAPVVFVAVTWVVLHELYPPLLPFVGASGSRSALPHVERLLRVSAITLALTPYLGLLALALTDAVDNRFTATVAAMGMGGYVFALAASPFIRARLRMIDRALLPLDEWVWRRDLT